MTLLSWATSPTVLALLFASRHLRQEKGIRADTPNSPVTAVLSSPINQKDVRQAPIARSLPLGFGRRVVNRPRMIHKITPCSSFTSRIQELDMSFWPGNVQINQETKTEE